LAAKLKEAYALRSKLVHGSISPFAPAIREYAPVAMRLVERALQGGLVFFESEALFDRGCTPAQLADGFAQLLQWTKSDSDRRTPKGKV
jgi:hypothetical protein